MWYSGNKYETQQTTYNVVVLCMDGCIFGSQLARNNWGFSIIEPTYIVRIRRNVVCFINKEGPLELRHLYGFPEPYYSSSGSKLSKQYVSEIINKRSPSAD